MLVVREDRRKEGYPHSREEGPISLRVNSAIPSQQQQIKNVVGVAVAAFLPPWIFSQSYVYSLFFVNDGLPYLHLPARGNERFHKSAVFRRNLRQRTQKTTRILIPLSRRDCSPSRDEDFVLTALERIRSTPHKLVESAAETLTSRASLQWPLASTSLSKGTPQCEHPPPLPKISLYFEAFLMAESRLREVRRRILSDQRWLGGSPGILRVGSICNVGEMSIISSSGSRGVSKILSPSGIRTRNDVDRDGNDKAEESTATVVNYAHYASFGW